MTDTHSADFSASRRSVLKLFSGGGVAVGGGLFGSETAVMDQYGQHDIDGEKCLVLIEDHPFADQDNVDVSVESLKDRAQQRQEPVIDKLKSQFGAEVHGRFWLTNAVLVDFSDSLVSAQDIVALDGIETLYPNIKITGSVRSQSARASEQPFFSLDSCTISEGSEDSGDVTATYGLEQIEAVDVWETLGTQGDGASVAVLDTGIDPNHPDLELDPNMWAAFDSDGNSVDMDPHDFNSHGTHVSGTVAGGNTSGIHIGVAPNIDLFHAKVLEGQEGSGEGTIAQVIGGMQWAVEQEVDVINISLGGEGFIEPFIDPIRNAEENGIIVVSSVGNTGSESSTSPGNLFDSLSVGATNSDREVASFSGGEKIDVDGIDFEDTDNPPDDWPTEYLVPDMTAPGVSVISSGLRGGWATKQGTSMASPHVAGVAALFRSIDPDLDPKSIKDTFVNTAIHPDGDGPDTRYGAGLLNAFRGAVDIAHDAKITGTVVTPTGSPVGGITVTSTYGISDQTDANGQYSLPVPEGEHTIQAQTFGRRSDPIGIEVSDTKEVDLTVRDMPDVRIAKAQPPDTGAETGCSLEFEVANVSEITVEFSSATAAVPKNSIVVEIDDTELRPANSESVSISAEDTARVEPSVVFESTKYTDEEGNVETQNLRSAIDDWREEQISTPYLREIIDGWLSDDLLFSADSQVGLTWTFTDPDGESIVITTGPTTVLSAPEPPAFEIVDPKFQSTVDLERVLHFTPEITNTGDLTGPDSVKFETESSSSGFDHTFEMKVSIPPEETRQVEFQLALNEDFLPIEEATQRIVTSESTAEDTFSAPVATYNINDVDAPSTVDSHEPFEVEVTLNNTGQITETKALRTKVIELSNGTDTLIGQQNVTIDAESSETISVTISPQETEDNLSPGNYEIVIMLPEFGEEQRVEIELT